MPIAHIGYDPNSLMEGEKTKDYVENVQGDLVPMYYTIAQLQYIPPDRITIKCFGCGSPHKKVDCPNHMTPGAFIPLCGDCGPGHPVFECPLRVQVQVSQAPATPINMIGAISHSNVVPVNVITRSRAHIEGIDPEEPTRSREVAKPKAKKATPIDYPDVEVELERLKTL